MKKIFTLFAALMMVFSMSAKTIYLHTGGGGLWNQAGAKFGCHTWGSADKSGFMTHVEGDIYSFETLDANTDVIFTRVDPDATGIWDKEWNRIQTKFENGKDMFTMTDWSKGTWGVYTPLVTYTFTKGTTLYIDFRAITGDKKGANYPKAGEVGVDYSANAGGTVIPVTFTADVKWAEGSEFLKTDQGGWASIPFKAPTADENNCVKVAADGKSYTWATYSEPTVTLSLDKTSADAGTEVTVTLTATADNVTGDVTYAFQYSTDEVTWNNIEATGNTVEQTFAAETRYYKVTMTNGGTTKEATAKFTAIKFYVVGSWDNWTKHNEMVEGSYMLTLEADSTYEYKITAGNWDFSWGNDGTMTRENSTNWLFESVNNAKITTDLAGDYVFNVSRNEEGKVKVSVTYPVVDAPKTIEWVLNGGDFPAVVVPTNAELWEAFKPYYNKYYTANGKLVKDRADQPIDKVSTFAAAYMQEIMTDEKSEYKWLGDYVLGVAAGQGVTLPTDMVSANEGAWRWAVHAFFNATAGANGAAGTDFTEAGKPEVWGAAYQAANVVVLPTEAVDTDYTLPTPVKTGFTFLGWYDNAEGEGEAMTVLKAGWSGTIYAIWKQGSTTGVENTIVVEKAMKIVRNGQVLILVGDKTFDMMGQEVK